MIEHLSYSSISLYQSCPRAWKFRYVDRVKTLPTPALIFGTAFHNTLENYYRRGGVDSATFLPGIWQQEWAKVCEQEVNWDSELPEQFENDGQRILASPQVLGVIAEIRPLMVDDKPVIERFVRLSVPGVPVPIIGYIDIMTIDHVPCDIKTAGRAWTQDQAQDEMQPLFYLAALTQESFVMNGLPFCHYVFTKTAKPQAQRIKTERKIGELFWLLSAIRDVWRGIEREVFFPISSGWKCSPKWCDYWKVCRGR